MGGRGDKRGGIMGRTGLEARAGYQLPRIRIRRVEKGGLLKLERVLLANKLDSLQFLHGKMRVGGSGL